MRNASYNGPETAQQRFFFSFLLSFLIFFFFSSFGQASTCL